MYKSYSPPTTTTQQQQPLTCRPSAAGKKISVHHFLLKFMLNCWLYIYLSVNYLLPLCQMVSHGAPYDPSADHDGVGLINPALGHAVGTAVKL